MHRFISVIVATIALAVMAAPAGARVSTDASPAWRLSIEQACPGHYQGIAYYRKEVWRYERRMSARITRATYAEHSVKSCEAVIPFIRHWRNLSYRRRHEYVEYIKALHSTGIPAGRPPHYLNWLCIHRYEGAWNDPNPPYYGGLQMDLSFQRVHAGRLLAMKGTADHWTPLEQMWAAEDAYRTSGFYPWPNTARYCGLIR